MSGVRIVTDSACDLTSEEAAALDITVVPLSIRFGTEEFTDREELSVEEFYRRMAESSALPETSAPAPGAFEAVFRTAADEGADAVVCINLSSALSATMQSAQTAASSLSGTVDVRVLDSRSITGGLGTEVLLAAQAARDGASADEVVALVNETASRTKVFGALDTLENLKKGGRIGGAQSMLGSMLSIKPIIDISSGSVTEAAKQRTRRKSLEWLRNKLLEEPSVEHLSILHGDAPDVDDFLAMIEPDFPRSSYRLGKIGAVIGSHGGPRIVGICYVTG